MERGTWRTRASKPARTTQADDESGVYHSAFASTSQVPMEAFEGKLGQDEPRACSSAMVPRAPLAACRVEHGLLHSDTNALNGRPDAETLGLCSSFDADASPAKERTDRRTHRRRSRRRMAFLPSMPMLLALATLLALLVNPAKASIGDRSPEYRLCVDSCDRDSCLVPPWWDDGIAHATRLPWILRVTRWTCIDDCRYHCTHRVTNEAHDRVAHIKEETKAEVEGMAEANGWSVAQQRTLTAAKVQARLDTLRPVQKQMVQYHGKWVFIRFLGAQEPLSVLFSLMNLYVHVKGFNQMRRLIPDYFPLKLIYLLHALLSCLAWTSSAVFHARDKPVTERLDYFFAGGVVLGGLFYTICRLFRIRPSTRLFRLLAQGFGTAFGLHVVYLSFGRFDYAYNMQANILIAIVHSLLWLAFSLNPKLFVFAGSEGTKPRSNSMGAHTAPRLHSNGGSPPVPVSTPTQIPPSSSRKSRRSLQKILALLWLASALEVFDFAPLYRALDAHALWHLATVPVARMWYTWLIDDARECVASGFWAADMDAFTAKYLEIPHKTEEAVEKMGRKVGPPVMRAMEKARELIETAAGKGSDAMNATGTSSGIEFKALTSKLNDLARTTLGNQSSSYGSQSNDALMHSHHRNVNAASAASSTGGHLSSDEEVPMVHTGHSLPSLSGSLSAATGQSYLQRTADTAYASSAESSGSGSNGSGGHAGSSSGLQRDSADSSHGVSTSSIQPALASNSGTARNNLEKYDYSAARDDV